MRLFWFHNIVTCQPPRKTLYSAVLKGEHKRPATCTDSLYEHVTRKKREFEVTNSNVQARANNPLTVSAMNTSHGNDTDKNADVEITNVFKDVIFIQTTGCIDKKKTLCTHGCEK